MMMNEGPTKSENGNGSGVKVGDGADLSENSSSSSDSSNGSATAVGRRKVTRKKKLKDIGKIAAVNGASCYSSMRTGPPMITITTPDDAPLPNQSDHQRPTEIERDSELGVGGGGGEVDLFSGAANSERDSRQTIAPTSSTSAGGGSGYQHQLPASHFMNVHNTMTSPATTSAPSSAMVQNHHLALTYYTHHEHLHPVLQQQQERRVSELPSPQYRSTITSTGGSQEQTNHVYQIPIRARDAIATTLSALYGKLIVVMGIAFPMAEVISTYIPPSFYEAFYLYLYIVSMIFLLFMYVTLLWGRPKLSVQQLANNIRLQAMRSHPPPLPESDRDSGEESDQESDSVEEVPHRRSHVNIVLPPPSGLSPPTHTAPRRHSFLMGGGSSSGTNKGSSHGSFYLRMGAVAFGIGSMIYSGLELGQYFELEPHTKCHNIMLALTPATRMVFIFIQMYFIFLNNEQMKVYRHKIIARFGLMHMIGTNLAVWLNVLIQETKHEILTFYNPENRTLRISHRLGHKSHSVHHSAQPMAVLGQVESTTDISTAVTHGIRVIRGLKGPHHIFECRRTNIIGTLVQDASPFLFPCTIEYSLICAAILYVMWRNISHPEPPPAPVKGTLSHPYKRSPHHYSVDCAQAHRGLFLGILALVLTIISLILFFVLISRPEFVNLAVTEVTICELTLYITSTIATIIGMLQVRHLQYDALRSFQLDDILLVGAQTGLFLYSTFTVISGQFMTVMPNDTALVLVTALASILQTAFQTMFILDACRRSAATSEQMRKKPGREIVTFLLVSNLAMWAISTLEKSRAESHPIQLNFYGLWAWTIITHVSMPLAIFYRFHSTVCLCEIWKRTYKNRPNYR